MDFTNHSRPGPLTRSAGHCVRWRTSFQGEKSGRHRPVQRPILIGLQTIEYPAHFRDSWQGRYRSTRLAFRGLRLDWSGSRNPRVSRHNHYILISLALDRGSFAPHGARFARGLFSADSGVCVSADSRRPGVAAGQALLLFLTISRSGCRDGPPGANRSMSARGHRSGFPAHPWNFHEREHNVRARLGI